MPDTCDIALSTLTKTLEQMAFLAVWPAERTLELPGDAVYGCIGYDGPQRGRLELLTTRQLGAVLAANILAAAGPDDSEAQTRACDAIREVLNVTCGGILRHEPASSVLWRMGLPHVEPCEAQRWVRLLTEEGFEQLEAEGLPLAIRWNSGE